MFERLAARWRRWRTKRLERRTRAISDAAVQDLRSELRRRSEQCSKIVADLREKLAESERNREAEAEEFDRRIEQGEHVRERLTRQLELAELEIQQLGAIVTRDRSRVEAEAAVYERKASAIGRALQGEMIDE